MNESQPNKIVELEEAFPEFCNFSLIGKGGCGIVYLAVHTKFGFRVAIKEISKFNLNLKESATKNFQREVEILETVDFPFISSFYQLVESKNSFYFVLECCNRETLLHLLNERKKLSKEDIQRTFIQLAVTVFYFHNIANLVHRDIKLENILFDENMNVRMIDFGLSQFFKEIIPENSEVGPNNNSNKGGENAQKSTSSQPLMRTLCGSYPFVAPEIFRRMPYSKPVDVWSLGIVLYAMAFGKMPFESTNINLLVRKILQEEPYFPFEGGDRELYDLLSRMLNKDPDQRITIDEVLQHKWIKNSEYCRYSDISFLKSVQFKVNPNSTFGLDPQIAIELQKCGMDPINCIKPGTEEFLVYRALRKAKITKEIEYNNFKELLNKKNFVNKLSKKSSAPPTDLSGPLYLAKKQSTITSHSHIITNHSPFYLAATAENNAIQRNHSNYQNDPRNSFQFKNDARHVGCSDEHILEPIKENENNIQTGGSSLMPNETTNINGPGPPESRKDVTKNSTFCSNATLIYKNPHKNNKFLIGKVMQPNISPNVIKLNHQKPTASTIGRQKRSNLILT
ncbi:CAMK family protein kinase [Tritrichomonas foetus]|uniref:CAMK family protein kinase n=1 Tax=Tritrichomonas foetus TaxID=1144522 RepID=A0A1J4JLB8_9EUKA|nr:CAMK family protein kinase [Tritrichomonas foetus]|eukprot:OHS99207.1 CAMK family protein kinase [Tritrichomonas foetus]